ncbi:MORN repeat-containing protein 3-like isoform X2 [Apis laboriosa]|uniref:MORN repeat-containing protein 3-like isoform X2 n=1 Tax=Apis laboriosa TaxID=183418 RepID=UPI001CC3C117|nr:MORN repeat-containing protein 3-like isoform X2 [Apis laboriosa]
MKYLINFIMVFLKHIKTSYTRRKIENSKRNGLRHTIFSPRSKSYYIGEWKNDIKEGRGREVNRDGWIYDGSWLNDKKHGCGILSKISKEDHKIRRYYIGEWVAGAKQGFGYNWFEDGSYYEGDFCRNKRHGYGRIWYCNGDYYEGAWKNDLYHGLGIFIKDNGNKYEGQFVNGKKEGYGTFYHIITGQEQHGFWTSDLFINGTMLDADFRQCASRPTPYPIPEIKLISHIKSSQDISEINDQKKKLSYTEDLCRRIPKHIIANICVSRNTCSCLNSVLYK